GQQGSLTSTGREPEIFGLMPMSGTQRTSVDYRLSHTGRDKAQSYDRRFAENPHRAMMWALERDVIDEIIRTRLGGKVGSYLDFACGTGRILAHVERCADKAVGVDVSPAMLEIAQSRVSNAELIECDVTRSPCLAGRSFQ